MPCTQDQTQGSLLSPNRMTCRRYCLPGGPNIPTSSIENPLRRCASLATIRCKCGILTRVLIRLWNQMALVHAVCTYGRLHTFYCLVRWDDTDQGQ